MERLAFGQLGMSSHEFLSSTPREFYNRLKGFFDFKKWEDRQNWERTRWQTWHLINVQLKKEDRIKLTDIVLPHEAEGRQKEQKETQEIRQATAEKWLKDIKKKHGRHSEH